MLRRSANAAIRLFLEPPCLVCTALLIDPIGSPICAACWRSVERMTPPWCDRCGDALSASSSGVCARCRAAPLDLARCRSAGFYTGALRHAIHALKYDGCRVLARPLSRLMIDSGADVLDGATAVVPVPLSRRRLMSRGFNQADDLARHLGLPVWPALRRTRHGPAQAGLNAAARHANVSGAYARSLTFSALTRVPRFAANRLPQLSGATILLVDDVMTTGATLDACARALLAVGVVEVRALTVGRAAKQVSRSDLSGALPSAARPSAPRS